MFLLNSTYSVKVRLEIVSESTFIDINVFEDLITKFDMMTVQKIYVAVCSKGMICTKPKPNYFNVACFGWSSLHHVRFYNQILKDVNVDDIFSKVCKVCTSSVQDLFLSRTFLWLNIKASNEDSNNGCFLLLERFFLLFHRWWTIMKINWRPWTKPTGRVHSMMDWELL